MDPGSVINMVGPADQKLPSVVNIEMQSFSFPEIFGKVKNSYSGKKINSMNKINLAVNKKRVPVAATPSLANDRLSRQ